MTEPFWTEERLSHLRELLEAGYSKREAAGMLGCSRNAIIGKLRRMEIASGTWIGRSRAKTSSRTGKESPAEAVDSKTRAARTAPGKAASGAREHHTGRPKPPPAPIVVPPGVACGILETSGCRWAVGYCEHVAGGHLFCNAAAPDGQSYCEAHRRDSVVPYSAQIIRKTLRGLPG